jgi:hypothetical protein
MTTSSKKTRVVSLVIVAGALGGALSLWPIMGDDARKFNALKADALCVLHLPEGTSSVSATFTTRQVVEMLQVAIQTKARGAALSISIANDQGIIASASGITAHSFGLGRRIQPGTYTATLRQEVKGKGGTAVIADQQPVFVTGWQIWSRTYVGLLLLSGICVLLWPESANSRARASSITAFHSLLLGLVLIFVYLLFHEGGHALVEMTFGRFDIARSDFWGIHGHPHSGGTMGPPPEPWQQTVISCAGPMLPIFAGFGLFVLWGLPAVRNLRSVRPMVNLYLSAIVAILVLSEAVCEPLYLLGFMTAEGDLIGRVTESGGPVWLVKGLLWGSFLISAIILWRVLPEVWKSWKAQFLQPWTSVPHAPAA